MEATDNIEGLLERSITRFVGGIEIPTLTDGRRWASLIWKEAFRINIYEMAGHIFLLDFPNKHMVEKNLPGEWAWKNLNSCRNGLTYQLVDLCQIQSKKKLAFGVAATMVHPATGIVKEHLEKNNSTIGLVKGAHQRTYTKRQRIATCDSIHQLILQLFRFEDCLLSSLSHSETQRHLDRQPASAPAPAPVFAHFDHHPHFRIQHSYTWNPLPPVH